VIFTVRRGKKVLCQITDCLVRDPSREDLPPVWMCYMRIAVSKVGYTRAVPCEVPGRMDLTKYHAFLICCKVFSTLFWSGELKSQELTVKIRSGKLVAKRKVIELLLDPERYALCLLSCTLRT
jgi:hypothetical protein